MGKVVRDNFAMRLRGDIWKGQALGGCSRAVPRGIKLRRLEPAGTKINNCFKKTLVVPDSEKYI